VNPNISGKGDAPAGLAQPFSRGVTVLEETKPSEARKRIVAVDIDGVLGETQIHLLDRANPEFGTHVTKNDLKVWNCRIGPSTFGELIERYLLDSEWVMGIPVIRGAQEGVDAIRQSADVIIASDTVPGTESSRIAWIERNFGFRPVFINTRGTQKANLQADALIDDYEQNLTAFLEPKPERVGILIKQPWNQNAMPHPRIARAMDWNELTKCVTEEAPFTVPWLSLFTTTRRTGIPREI
jgi:5'-nucleotidase